VSWGPDPPTSTCGTCGNHAHPVTLSGWWGKASRGLPDALNFGPPTQKFMAPPHFTTEVDSQLSRHRLMMSVGGYDLSLQSGSREHMRVDGGYTMSSCSGQLSYCPTLSRQWRPSAEDLEVQGLQGPATNVWGWLEGTRYVTNSAVKLCIDKVCVGIARP